IDIISYLLISLFIAIFFWPYLGVLGVIVVLVAAAYLIYAWMNADLIVAGKAGFTPPTPLQQGYLENLGIIQEVFTHPSLLAVAGTLASSKHRLILLTSGVFKELSEDDLRQLIEKLSARDSRAVFGWTFHLATGGARLFSRVDQDDPFAGYWRKMLVSGVVGGVYWVAIAVLIAAPISMMFGRPIDISPIVPVFWLPLVYLVARFVWRKGNAALIKMAAGDWNRPITLEQVVFLPMSEQVDSYQNLNLLRSGLLIEHKRRSNSGECHVDMGAVRESHTR
ncbi:MAG TPA: hypothetical protein VE439_00160, partial [Anaerolineae bacterium]|nr:hypothetical protein [Anaerolineae bacterium]